MSGPPAAGDTAAAVGNIPVTIADFAGAAKNPAPVGDQYSIRNACHVIDHTLGDMSPCLPCCD